MDGKLDDVWGQYLTGLLDRDKVITLSNGEQLRMDESSFKLMFESGSMSQASPSILLDVVSWDDVH